ncbi:MAG: Flp pilus assembly protein CpaB [Rhodobacter sp.]|nr:Flp pilus assembly protein CpaB [Rhodobacter sp.]
MRLRGLLISLIGVCLAGASVWIADNIFSSNQTQAAPQVAAPKFVKVLVAKSDIQFGQIIDREVLTAQSWPVENVPEGAFTGTRALLGPENTGPRRAKRLIREGELIVEDRVSGFGETVTIVQALAPNTRAMAIEVDAATAVGGFVMPGDRVDIVLTEGRGSDLRAATILQDVRVLGIDQQSEKDKSAKRARTITVEVTPQDGQILALAQRAGTLSLTLRTQTEIGDADLAQISLADLLRDSEPEPEPEPEPEIAAEPEPEPRYVIRVRRGTEEDVVKLK